MTKKTCTSVQRAHGNHGKLKARVQALERQRHVAVMSMLNIQDQMLREIIDRLKRMEKGG